MAAESTLFGQPFGEGSAFKPPVYAASTTNAALSTYISGSTLDGVTIYAGHRILLKNQTDQPANGIYVVEGGGAAPSRSADFDTAGDMVSGTIVAVQVGTTNGNTMWMFTTDGIIVVGTSNLAFTQLAI